MQPDLLGLEITKGELRRLTGVDPEDVFRPSILKNREKRFAFFMNEVITALSAYSYCCWFYLCIYYFTYNRFLNSDRIIIVSFSTSNGDISTGVFATTKLS